MIKTFIIISDNENNCDNINKLINNIIDLKVLIDINKKIPLIIKLGNFVENKIIYKNNEYIFDNNIDILLVNNIINKLNNDIYFDKIILEINNIIDYELMLLPYYKNDYNDYKLISLYTEYLKLDNINIIYFVNDIQNNIYFELFNNYNKITDTIIIYKNNDENINLLEYKKNFDNFDNFIIFFKEINLTNLNYNKLLNNLYLDLDNYEGLIKADYESFFKNIYIGNIYRHHHFYKHDNNKIICNNYNDHKQIFNSENNKLLDQFKDYENIINLAINYFDEFFDIYINKLEPVLLQYFTIMYYNSNNYSEDFEINKDLELLLMLKGLRKMCINLVKKKILKI